MSAGPAVSGGQERNAGIQEALRYAPMVGSLVAVTARLDPAALVGTGRVVGVVDHWAARVGFELPVDDHGASDRDGHARRKGQVVVDLDHDTLAKVDAEALMGAVRAVAVGKQHDHQTLNGHLRRAAVVQGDDEALVVRPDGVAEIGGVIPANPQGGISNAFSFNGTLNPPSFNTGSIQFQSLTAPEAATLSFFGPALCPPQ